LINPVLVGIDQKHSKKSKVHSAGSKDAIETLKVKNIARAFLQQLYSTIIFKHAVLQGNVWTVTMDVGLVRERIIRVKIDATSGIILGYL
jgi:hypothetical protein